MIKEVVQNEKGLFGLIGLNGSLAGIHQFFLAHQADLSVLLTVLQIVVALWTVYHLAKKALEKRKANKK